MKKAENHKNQKKELSFTKFFIKLNQIEIRGILLKKADILQYIRTNLAKLIKQTKECGIAIFEINTEKFVQFAYDSENKDLTCDIPLAELSPDEKNRLVLLEPFSQDSGALSDNNQLIAFHAYFKGGEIEKATNLTEQIFTKIFNSPNNYDLNVQLII